MGLRYLNGTFPTIVSFLGGCRPRVLLERFGIPTFLQQARGAGGRGVPLGLRESQSEQPTIHMSVSRAGRPDPKLSLPTTPWFIKHSRFSVSAQTLPQTSET